MKRVVFFVMLIFSVVNIFAQEKFDFTLRFDQMMNVSIWNATSDEQKNNTFYERERRYKIEDTIKALKYPLLIGGLSIGMREGVFANNPQNNFMEGVNMSLTLFGTGALVGILIEGIVVRGGNFNMPIIGFLFGGLGGILVGLIPQVQQAFLNNAVLYYIPTAAVTIGATLNILTIWRN